MRASAPLAALSLLLGAACATSARRAGVADGPTVRLAQPDREHVRLSLSRPAYVTVFATRRSGPESLVTLYADDSASGPRGAGEQSLDIPLLMRQLMETGRTLRGGPAGIVVVASDRPLADEAEAFETSYRDLALSRSPSDVARLRAARDAFLDAVVAHGPRVAAGSDLYTASDRYGSRAALSPGGMGRLGTPGGSGTICDLRTAGGQSGAGETAAAACGGASSAPTAAAPASPAAGAPNGGNRTSSAASAARLESLSTAGRACDSSPSGSLYLSAKLETGCTTAAASTAVRDAIRARQATQRATGGTALVTPSSLPARPPATPLAP